MFGLIAVLSGIKIYKLNQYEVFRLQVLKRFIVKLIYQEYGPPPLNIKSYFYRHIRMFIVRIAVSKHSIVQP
ncbi:hypothetical protein Avbf_07873 [Armadillidium vulgare]|nr:hypothetical protein Avbf_07873 [Armadillidium vulgare]